MHCSNGKSPAHQTFLCVWWHSSAGTLQKVGKQVHRGTTSKTGKRRKGTNRKSPWLLQQYFGSILLIPQRRAKRMICGVRQCQVLTFTIFSYVLHFHPSLSVWPAHLPFKDEEQIRWNGGWTHGEGIAQHDPSMQVTQLDSHCHSMSSISGCTWRALRSPIRPASMPSAMPRVSNTALRFSKLTSTLFVGLIWLASVPQAWKYHHVSGPWSKQKSSRRVQRDFCTSLLFLLQEWRKSPLIEAPNSFDKTRNASKSTDCHVAIYTSIIDVPFFGVLTLHFGRKNWHLVVDVTLTWKAVQAHPPRCPEGLLICLDQKTRTLWAFYMKQII